ncbi:MAG: hypothetical protein WCA21_06160 [Terracidiphilus sp.]
MIPVGYMAKHICKRPDWLKAPNIVDIFSVSACVSVFFLNDYIPLWKHNGYWFFDSPEIIQTIARENGIDLQKIKLFYYEEYELEFTGETWQSFSPEPSIPVNIAPPNQKKLEGFDVVTFSVGRSPGCSPLSCNGLAEELLTNSNCLLETFEEAESNLSAGQFVKCEDGPYRIMAVYSVDWRSGSSKRVSF